MFDLSAHASPALRDAMRRHGWAKLASAVMYENGLYPLREFTLAAGLEAIGMKIAVDATNHALIRQGLDAFRALRRTP